MKFSNTCNIHIACSNLKLNRCRDNSNLSKNIFNADRIFEYAAKCTYFLHSRKQKEIVLPILFILHNCSYARTGSFSI